VGVSMGFGHWDTAGTLSGVILFALGTGFDLVMTLLSGRLRFAGLDGKASHRRRDWEVGFLICLQCIGDIGGPLEASVEFEIVWTGCLYRMEYGYNKFGRCTLYTILTTLDDLIDLDD